MISTRRKARRSLVLLLPYAATAALVACGGGSGGALSTSPTEGDGATIEGTVQASGAGTSSASDVRAHSGGGAMKVSVVGTSISTTTDFSGGFVLSSVPSGSATLRFEAAGIDAILRLDGIVVGQTLRIAVRVSGPSAVLTGPITRTSPPTVPPSGSCFAVGAKAEVEGLIVAKESASNLLFGSLTVAQQAKGEFLCQVTDATRIRKGNQTLTLDDLSVGSRVHVSGTGVSSTGVCEVAAAEIKLQN